MWRRNRLLGALLLCAPVLLAACGGSQSTITIETPSAAPTTVQVAAASVEVGPGAVRHVVFAGGYRLRIAVTPNRATRANRVSVVVSRGGTAVRGAHVSLTASMLTMDMGTAHYRLAGAGTYSAVAPAWVMAGLWELAVTVQPPGGPPLTVGLTDRMRS